MERRTGWAGRTMVLSALVALALAGCAGRQPEMGGAAPTSAELAEVAPLVAEGDGIAGGVVALGLEDLGDDLGRDLLTRNRVGMPRTVLYDY